MLHFFPTKISAFVAIAVILCCYGNQMRVYGNCDVACAQEYKPICGTDGKTYGNDCEMYVQNNCDDTVVKKGYYGECRREVVRSNCEVGCLVNNLGPVCGTDGITYASFCEMFYYNDCRMRDTMKKKAYDGECSSIAYQSQDK